RLLGVLAEVRVVAERELGVIAVVAAGGVALEAGLVAGDVDRLHAPCGGLLVLVVEVGLLLGQGLVVGVGRDPPLPVGLVADDLLEGDHLGERRLAHVLRAAVHVAVERGQLARRDRHVVAGLLVGLRIGL